MEQQESMKGIIPGQPSEMQQYMQSLMNDILEDINKNIPESDNRFYIYTRYDPKKVIYKIFININLNPNEPPRKNEEPFYFLITITSKYPQSPPFLQCLSPYYFPSLCDRRDFRKCIIEDWKSNEKISNIIKLLPNFIRNVQNDINNKILIYYGEYYVESILYSVNGFLANPENIIKKIQIITEKHHKNIIEDRYIIITDLFFILLKPSSEKDKSLCTMSFYGKLDSINAIKPIGLRVESSNKQTFIIEWKPSATRMYSNYLLLDDPIELMTYISIKQSKIDLFKYVHGGEEMDIQKLTEMIKIKEECLDKYYDKYAFKCINEMYSRIIEISTMHNNSDNLITYNQKMQALFKKFESKCYEVNNK